jgi:hypothetical protein
MSASAPPRVVGRGPLETAIRFVGSYGLACVILLLLLLVVLLGTLAQMHTSLYDVQREYFEAPFFTVPLPGGIPLPLPGGSLLLAALLVNLLVGGVLRMRLGWRRIGILIAHVGIVLLLVGSAIEYARSDKGYISLREGESGDVFYSHHEWELVLREEPGPGAKEYVIPQGDLERAGDGGRIVRRHERLPFEVVLQGYARNAEVRAATSGEGVDGLGIQALGAAKEAERNVPAVYVTLAPRDGSAPARGLSWGLERAPWVAKVGGKRYEVDLRKQQWKVPFSVRLDRFVKRDHPGTMMAAEYSSYVTKTERGVSEERHITMNEPLRHKGYTFYQSGYGPQDPRSREPVYSVFSVVRNPTDQVPLWACLVIAAGLLLHFGIKLTYHLRRESVSRPVHAEVRA